MCVASSRDTGGARHVAVAHISGWFETESGYKVVLELHPSVQWIHLHGIPGERLEDILSELGVPRERIEWAYGAPVAKNDDRLAAERILNLFRPVRDA